MFQYGLVILFPFIDLAFSLSSPPSPSASIGHKNILIVGLGNVGQALFDQAKTSSSFHSVIGSTRSPKDPSVVPLSLENLKQLLLSDCTHLLVTIPPCQTMSDVLLLLSQQKNLLPGWIGIVSTTGVYGNHDGAWVTEDSTLNTNHPYFIYEQEWAGLSHHHLAIFRCAGLYGPTRSALHTLWKKGATTSTPPGTGTITNRIHEYDVVRAILAAMESNAVGIYNLADDEPENRDVVMTEAALLLRSIGKDPPGETDKVSNSSTKPNSRSQRRSTDVKRISNRKMKEELIPELAFPTYRQGLYSILHTKSNSWWTK